MHHSMKQLWGQAFCLLGRQWWRMLLIAVFSWAVFFLLAFGVMHIYMDSHQPVMSHAVRHNAHSVKYHHFHPKPLTKAQKMAEAKAMQAEKKWQAHLCDAKSLAKMRSHGVSAGNLVIMGCSKADVMRAGYTALDIQVSVHEDHWFDMLMMKYVLMTMKLKGAPWLMWGLIGGVFVLVLMGVAAYWYDHLLLMDVSEQQVDLWASFKVVMSRLHHVIALFLLQMIIILLGLVLLVLPGIALAVYLSMGFAFVLLKNQNAIEAIKSSYRLVRGHWWYAWGVVFIPMALWFVIQMVLLRGGKWVGMGAVAVLLLYVLKIIYYFFTICLSPCLYKELCNRQSSG